MKVKAMISVIPIGVGVSLSGYIAACERTLEAAGLERHLHAHGTNVEGEWEVVLDAVRRCVEELHRLGAPRVATFLKLSTRTDRDTSMDDMVRSVESKLESGEA